MKKEDPQVYEDMYKDYVDEFYDKFLDELIIKEHILFAGDTTVIKVPNVSKSKEEFPVDDACMIKIINVCRCKIRFRIRHQNR